MKAMSLPDKGTAVPARTAAGRARPFVKWAGGKRALIPRLLEIVPDRISRYHEPFVGGGALFYALERRIGRAYLSDANPELMMAYQAIRDDVEKVISLLEKHSAQHSKPYYMRMRKQTFESHIEMAARFIYLNRTCYNGLYRVNSKDEFNVPMGRYDNPLICDQDNLRSVSAALQKAQVRWGGYEKAELKANDLVYCDPPYDDTYNQYTSSRFDAKTQRALAKKAAEWADRGANVMISNSDTDLVRSLYRGRRWKFIEVKAPRNINCNGDGRKAVTELLITNINV